MHIYILLLYYYYYYYIIIIIMYIDYWICLIAFFWVMQYIPLFLKLNRMWTPSSGPDDVYRNLIQVLQRMWKKDLEVWHKDIEKKK